MNNNQTINQHNLGLTLVAENCQRVSVNELVRKATRELKKRLVEAQIEALGVSVRLTTSNTRFNGERLWFKCPICNKRVGTLFNNEGLGCRKCLKLMYKKQRFKGMLEASYYPI